jgi:archaemetzincin
MLFKYILFTFLIQFGILFSCTQLPNHVQNFSKLSCLDNSKPVPQKGEWLAEHKEQLQSISEYISSNPKKTNAEKKYLYVTLIGEITESEKKFIEKTKLYLSIFYQIQIKELKCTNLIPKRFQRNYGGFLQLNSIYILDSILAPQLPNDGFGCIAFTTSDLYPAADWNFVFGQANLQKGVGVWSLARLQNQDQNLFAKRTMQVAVHEVGHMFGIKHCVNYECTMNGSNSIQETDAQPMWMCHDCTSKLAWNRELNFEKYFEQIQKFWINNKQIDTNAFIYYNYVNTIACMP